MFKGKTNEKYENTAVYPRGRIEGLAFAIYLTAFNCEKRRKLHLTRPPSPRLEWSFDLDIIGKFRQLL